MIDTEELEALKEALEPVNKKAWLKPIVAYLEALHAAVLDVNERLETIENAEE